MASSMGGELLSSMPMAANCVKKVAIFQTVNPDRRNRHFRRRTAHWPHCSIRTNDRVSVVQSSEGLNIPILSCAEVLEKMRENQAAKKSQYLAMYSSIAGGITTDPAAMVIPIDDHMVHRGHGVFDTAAITDGFLYELDQHLDRILRSASMAKIIPPFERETMKNILIETVRASKCKQGSLRYWISAGPGDFYLSPSNCPSSSFYAIVLGDNNLPKGEGVKVVTSSIPIKPPQFAILKSVNYLPNAMSKMEAEEKGAFAAIWLDDEGFIAEGPNMNVGFVTEKGELLMPKFDKILSGCTARRILVLAVDLIKRGILTGIQVRDITVEEGKRAHEMMLIGSGILVKPVLQWDDDVIGNGKEGPVARALLELIITDMQSGPPEVRTMVYDYS